MSRMRRKKRKKTASRGFLMVALVVGMMLVMISAKSIQLNNKQKEYSVRQEELKQQIADEEARTQELAELEKYVKTDSYAEEVAEDKLGLVRKGEIVFKMK